MTEYTPTTELIRERASRDAFGTHDVMLTVDFDRWLAAHDAGVRAAALEEAAQIAEGWVEHYPEDIFPPVGTSVDAHSARVVRLLSPSIARTIRAAKEQR